MEIGEIVRVEVRRIKNGYVINARKDTNYDTMSDQPVFVPDLEDIEGDLANAFRLGCLLSAEQTDRNF